MLHVYWVHSISYYSIQFRFSPTLFPQWLQTKQKLTSGIKMIIWQCIISSTAAIKISNAHSSPVNLLVKYGSHWQADTNRTLQRGNCHLFRNSWITIWSLNSVWGLTSKRSSWLANKLEKLVVSWLKKKSLARFSPLSLQVFTTSGALSKAALLLKEPWRI